MRLDDVKEGIEVISHGVRRKVQKVNKDSSIVSFTDGTTNYARFLCTAPETTQQKVARLEAEVAELKQPKVGQVYTNGTDTLLITYVGKDICDVVYDTGLISSHSKEYINNQYELTNTTPEEFIKELVK